MFVEPQDPNGVDPHNIPGPDGLTDYQRWEHRGRRHVEKMLVDIPAEKKVEKITSAA